MFQPAGPRSTRSPELYRRIHYDTSLEGRAFECLAESDFGRSREAFGDLVAGLCLDAAVHDKDIVQLLLDVLQKVNRRVHRIPQDEAAYQERRIALIREFAPLETAAQARGAFLPTLNRLLAARRDPESATQALVGRARSFIDQHYQERIFLSTVARKLNVSANHLSRVFRKATGATLTCYVQRRRLEHARLLLAEGQHTISEIAYMVGYQHYRDFYRNFVKHENASPREMRRRMAAGTPPAAAGAAEPQPGSSVL